MKPEDMGFQEIRVKVLVDGDASREELDEIVRHANFFSPVANTMRNPIQHQPDGLNPPINRGAKP